MAGKYTNQIYDKDAYKEELNRSVQPGEYRLDINYVVNNNQCFAPYGPWGNENGSSDTGNQIDIDSTIRGIDKIHSKSNKQQEPGSLNGYKTRMPTDCQLSLSTEYSRFITPAYDIRGLNTMDLNLDFPLNDPQCKIYENHAINTRLMEKDNHKAIWQVPINQNDLQPNIKLGKPYNCSVEQNCKYSIIK